MGLRVVIVDDAGFIRHLLSQLLSALSSETGGRLDCVVIGEARTGREAVDLVLRSQPDLVFMDLVLPEKNGVDATIEIRETKTHLPIIAMSTLDDPAIIDQALRAGCMSFLPKPFSRESVRKVIESVKDLKHEVRYG